MHLLNATKMPAGFTVGMRAGDGRDILVVVVKGTFSLPKDGNPEPTLAEEQAPLVMTDAPTGEPGLSAPLYEIDFALRKPRCDVLLNGSAYAPSGKSAQRVTVSLRAGTVAKSFDVVGNRVWKSGALSVSVGAVEPFRVMPISYDNAFGGVNKAGEGSDKDSYYLENFAGIGYHEKPAAKFIEGKPLPNTEETGNKITKPNGNYRPMAFGPVGRAWKSRAKLAGTYDKKWLDERFPLLPLDFDEHYFQAAPPEQQMDYPMGGEEIELVNLTPEGRRVFRLPRVRFPILFFLKSGEQKESMPVIDTVVIEPDLNRCSLTWRSALALRKNVFEVSHVVVDEKQRSSYRRWETANIAKPRFRSLADLIASNRK